MNYTEFVELKNNYFVETEALRKKENEVRSNFWNTLEGLTDEDCKSILKEYFLVNKLKFSDSTLRSCSFVLETKKAKEEFIQSYETGSRFHKFLKEEYGFEINKTYWDSSYSEKEMGIILKPIDTDKVTKFFEIFDFSEELKNNKAFTDQRSVEIKQSILDYENAIKELKQELSKL